MAGIRYAVNDELREKPTANTYSGGSKKKPM